MKQKQTLINTKELLILIILSILFLTSLNSCRKNDQTDISDIIDTPDTEPSFHTTDVLRMGIQEYGDYVYFDSAIYRTICAYDTTDNTVTNACTNPMCANRQSVYDEPFCLLECGFTIPFQIADGKIFFRAENNDFDDDLACYLGYQDIITGEVVSPEVFFKVFMKDYGKIENELKKAINGLTEELGLSKRLNC